MECTVKATEPDVPSFVYDPVQDIARDGFAGKGLGNSPWNTNI
jgi:hypothetical protein